MVAGNSELTPRYPSDLSDEEWGILKQLLGELDPYTIGRPRKSDQREILNAIFYYPGKTPGPAGGLKKFDNYGSPSRKLRAVSRQAHTCGESRWTNLRA